MCLSQLDVINQEAVGLIDDKGWYAITFDTTFATGDFLQPLGNAKSLCGFIAASFVAAKAKDKDF